MHSHPWVRILLHQWLPVLTPLTPLPDQAETVSRRVEKFAELMYSVWLSKNDYERRVREVGLGEHSGTFSC